MLPFFVGMFAVGTVLGDILNPPTAEGAAVNASHEGIFMNRAAWRRNLGNLFRSSAIGSGVGVLPGIGSNIASMVAYVAARSLSKKPEKFGKGSEEGIVASEAANNSAVGGALVPTLAMGVPGSFVDVLLLAAFLIHSIQPGPLLFVNNQELVFGLIASYLVANILMFLIMLASIKFVARLARFPRAYLFPLILIFSVIGAFALDNSAWSLWAMLLCGVLGFVMERLKFPLAPLAIAFVLGPLAEQKLRVGLQITGGSYAPLYSDPTSVGLLALALAMLVVPLLRIAVRGRSAGLRSKK